MPFLAAVSAFMLALAVASVNANPSTEALQAILITRGAAVHCPLIQWRKITEYWSFFSDGDDIMYNSRRKRMDDFDANERDSECHSGSNPGMR